jgi:hypothetical protein
MITGHRRPIAIEELRNWINRNDKRLWNQISSMSHDYIRIIINETKSNIFVKYKSRLPIEGIDRRAIFFGLAKEQYNSLQWLPICDGQERNVVAQNMRKIPKNEAKTDDWASMLWNGAEWLQFIEELRPIRFHILNNPRNKDDIDRIMAEFEIAKLQENYML